MFYVELKSKSNNKDIYDFLAHFLIVESNSNHHIPNVRFLNTLTARDTDTLKVFAFLERDASNAQKRSKY